MIQPYGCIYADRPSRLRSHVRRASGPHTAAATSCAARSKARRASHEELWRGRINRMTEPSTTNTKERDR
jgi:hypothetical protein